MNESAFFVLKRILLIIFRLTAKKKQKVGLRPPSKVVHDFHILFSNPPKGASYHQTLGTNIYPLSIYILEVSLTT